EATAHIRDVYLHLVGWQARCRNCRLMRSGLPLRRDVDVTAVRAEVSRAVHRLPGGVRGERGFERALEGSWRPGESGVGIAVVARDLSRLLRECLVALHDGGARQ